MDFCLMALEIGDPKAQDSDRLTRQLVGSLHTAWTEPTPPPRTTDYLGGGRRRRHEPAHAEVTSGPLVSHCTPESGGQAPVPETQDETTLFPACRLRWQAGNSGRPWAHGESSALGPLGWADPRTPGGQHPPCPGAEAGAGVSPEPPRNCERRANCAFAPAGLPPGTWPGCAPTALATGVGWDQGAATSTSWVATDHATSAVCAAPA